MKCVCEQLLIILLTVTDYFTDDEKEVETLVRFIARYNLWHEYAYNPLFYRSFSHVCFSVTTRKSMDGYFFAFAKGNKSYLLTSYVRQTIIAARAFRTQYALDTIRKKNR